MILLDLDHSANACSQAHKCVEEGGVTAVDLVREKENWLLRLCSFAVSACIQSLSISEHLDIFLAIARPLIGLCILYTAV